MANDIHQAEAHDALLLVERHGEEQLVVLAAVERCDYGVDVHLLCKLGCLACNGNTLKVYARATLRRAANLTKVACKTIREVNHRCWLNALLLKCVDDVDAGAGLEVTLQEVFVARELRLGVCDILQYALLALQEVETHVCRTEVGGDADKVVLLGTRTICYLALLCATRSRDCYYKAIHRGGGVATHDVHAKLLCCMLHALVEFVECLNRNLCRYAERYDHLLGLRVHREDVVHATHYSFVAEVLKREVAQVEVYALGHHICCEEHNLVAEVYYCGIVTRCHECRIVAAAEA